MGVAVRRPVRKLAAAAFGSLPPRMRVLFITSELGMGRWLAEALQVDSACDVVLQEARGIAAGLAKLRDEAFDAVLVSHDGRSIDAFDLLDAIRTGSTEQQPIIVLGEASESELTPLCYESGGDAYLCVNQATARTLIWELARATQRRELLAETRRLQQEHRTRIAREHDEALRLLEQQRAIITDLEAMCRDAATEARPEAVSLTELPATLIDHYRELLRAYVVMGTGNLADEMNRLAELLGSASVTARQVVLLHLQVLEDIVGGLGSRSARHVMNRADLLILEVTVKLADAYRQRLVEQSRPARQQLLPGF